MGVVYNNFAHDHTHSFSRSAVAMRMRSSKIEREIWSFLEETKKEKLLFLCLFLLMSFLVLDDTDFM